MQDWQREEILRKIREMDELKRRSGIDFNNLPRHINSALNNADLFRMHDAFRLKIELPKLNSLFNRIDLPQFRINITLPSTYFDEMGRSFSSLNKRISDNFPLFDISRKFQNALNSNLSTAMIISSLRSEEISLLQKQKLNLPRFPKIKLPDPLIRGLAISLNRPEILDHIEFLRNSFAGDLAFRIRESIESSASNEEAQANVEALIEERISQLPKNNLSKEFWINLLVTIFFGLLSWYFAQASLEIAKQQLANDQKTANEQNVQTEKMYEEQKVKAEQMFKMFEKLVNKLSENAAEEDEEHKLYYIVQRNVFVKNRPNFKSPTIDFLLPNTKVALIESNHQWIYIEYIDQYQAILKRGWVNKKYLKISK
jgi:hypothetical protein